MHPSPPLSASPLPKAGLSTSVKAANSTTAAIGGGPRPARPARKVAAAPSPTAKTSPLSPKNSTARGSRPAPPPEAPPSVGKGPVLPSPETMQMLEGVAQSLYRDHGALEVEAVVNAFCVVITNNGESELDLGHWLFVRLPGAVTDTRATRVQIVRGE